MNSAGSAAYRSIRSTGSRPARISLSSSKRGLGPRPRILGGETLKARIRDRSALRLKAFSDGARLELTPKLIRSARPAFAAHGRWPRRTLGRHGRAAFGEPGAGRRRLDIQTSKSGSATPILRGLICVRVGPSPRANRALDRAPRTSKAFGNFRQRENAQLRAPCRESMQQGSRIERRALCLRASYSLAG